MTIIEPKKHRFQTTGGSYEIGAIGARKAGKISSKFITKAVNAGVGYASGNLEGFYGAVAKFSDDETMDDLYELAFSEESSLKYKDKSGNYVKVIDPDMHFMGKYLEMMQVCFYALRYNCDDFFTSIGGLLAKDTNSLKTLKDMAENETIPEEIRVLLQTFLPKEAS